MLLAGLRVAELDGLALLERERDGRDLAGEGFRNLRRGLLRAERARIRDHGAEHAQGLRRIDLRVGELVGLLHRAVEIRADDEAVEIADDEQRRVEQ